MPPSQHVLLSRMSYLHVGLREDVLRLYKYAPALTILKGMANMSMASTAAFEKKTKEKENRNITDEITKEKGGNDHNTSSIMNATDDPFRHKDHAEIPICWFEDEVTGIALRWHLFAGVLYDLLKYRHLAKHSNINSSQNEDINDNAIPWRIRIHFTSYPSSILSLEHYASSSSTSNTTNTVSSPSLDATANVDFHIPKSVPLFKIIQQAFSNSLKQSLFLQHGSSKVAMSMSKFSHVKLWEAIMRNKCDDFWEVSLDLMQTNLPYPTPSPPTKDSDGSTSSSAHETNDSNAEGGKGEEEKALIHIPVRLLMDGKPYMQRPCKLQSLQEEFIHHCNGEHPEYSSVCSYFTLGRLLSTWLPSYFETITISKDSDNDDNDGIVSIQYKLKSGNTFQNLEWDIQGIRPALSTPIVDLWLALCHPDHFLYITVSTLA